MFELRDINPVAPTHVLIIPKRRDGLTQLRHATADHAGILGHMLEVAASIAIQEKLEGYRCLCTGYGGRGVDAMLLLPAYFQFSIECSTCIMEDDRSLHVGGLRIKLS